MLFSLTRSNNNNKRNNTDCRVNFFLSFVLVSNDYPSLIFVFLEIFFFFFLWLTVENRKWIVCHLEETEMIAILDFGLGILFS